MLFYENKNSIPSLVFGVALAWQSAISYYGGSIGLVYHVFGEK
jgi:hypothetical protein